MTSGVFDAGPPVRKRKAGSPGASSPTQVQDTSSPGGISKRQRDVLHQATAAEAAGGRQAAEQDGPACSPPSAAVRQPPNANTPVSPKDSSAGAAARPSSPKASESDTSTATAAAEVPNAAPPPKRGDKLYWSFARFQTTGQLAVSCQQLMEALGLEEEPKALRMEVDRMLGEGTCAWVVAAKVTGWLRQQLGAAAGAESAAEGGQQPEPVPRPLMLAIKIHRLHHEMDPTCIAHPSNQHDAYVRYWFKREVTVLQLGGPHLPQLYSYGWVSSGIPPAASAARPNEVPRRALLMELDERGSLDQVMARRPGAKKGLPRSDIKSYMRDMVAGLALLHANNIIYRDLKPLNALLATNPDGTHTIKLADFATSEKLEPGRELEQIGSPSFWSPELHSKEPYGLPADIWALGPTRLHLLKGRPPWYFLTPDQDGLRWEVATLRQAWCPYSQQDEDGDALGPQELGFLDQVMTKDPAGRPTAEELLEKCPYLCKDG